MKNVFAAAPQRITFAVLLRQFLGNAILLPLASLWLLIPDSHAWQFAVSVLSGLALVVIFLYLHTDTLRRLRQSAKLAPWWSSMLLLVVWIIAAYILAGWIGHINDKMDERAGYWNSHLSPQLRTFFTYRRLVGWQENFVTILTWVVLPILLLPFSVETISTGLGSWRNGLRTLRRWQLWVTVIVISHLGFWLTEKLFAWLPGRSVRGELVSVVFRFGLIYLLDLTLLLFTFAVVAELLARNESARQPIA